jgi:hypothetical protein
MNYKKKIGWQKYEDYIEKQLSSPLLTTIIQNIVMQQMGDKFDDLEEEEDDEDYDNLEDKKANIIQNSSMIPLTPQLMEDVTMLSSFDCWIGHTNFDLTHTIKEVLNKVPGVEVLKICSRYRFFIGIGQMFDFKNVRSDVEKAIIGDIE